jgi:hypothetical protein
MKLKHRITGTILAIVFATTSALPAAGIPNLKTAPAPKVAAAPRVPAPPKVISPPKIPAAPRVPVVSAAPRVPKVPALKIPATPKVPAVVKVPTVKIPVVKTPAAPKMPAIKSPVVKVPATAKVPVAATLVKAPVSSKVVASNTPAKIPGVSTTVSTKSSEDQTSKRAVDSSSAVARQKKGERKADAKTDADKKRVVIVMGYKAKHDAEKSNQNDGSQSPESARVEKPVKKEKDFTGIEEAYRRMQASEEADQTGDDSKDPYVRNGGIDRDQLSKDERLIADFENDQTGAQRLLDDARKPRDPNAPATPDDEEDGLRVPVSVTRGRIKDIAKVEGVGQITGLNGDEPELVDAKDDIARGVVRDPKLVDRLVDKVANKGVDKQFGEAPDVDVEGLTRIGDALKKRGKYKEARDYYDQAIDALKNGGKNSAAYRLQVIAEVDKGLRPAGDLDRVVKPGGAGTKEPAATEPGAGDGPATAPAPVTTPAPQDTAPAPAPAGQRVADGVASKDKDKPASTPGAGPVGQGTAAAGQDVNAGQPANTGAQDTAAQDGASAGISNQLGSDTQNVGANSPQNAAAETPSSNNDVAGNNEAPSSNPNATVSSPEDEIVLGSPGNNNETIGHTQSADGNTGGSVVYRDDGTFTATVTTVTRDADGKVVSSTTTTVEGTYSEGTDGQRHHNPTSSTTTENSSSSNGQGAGTGGEGSGSNSNDSDGDDDKDDDKSTTTDTTDTNTETEADETTEANDDTAEASEEGTPNPEARERGGRSGRMAEATQGRVGGEEQRNQRKGLDQRKNGNGAAGPDAKENGSSGVLLTAQEQKLFAKNLGMKSGGGVTTPAENDRSFAVTERDMKDIAARRGSLINPATAGDGKGGSGVVFGKKGFAPGAGGAPAPAPKGKQSSDDINGGSGVEGGSPSTGAGSGTGGSTGSIFGGTAGPGVSPVRAGAAAASAVRGANVRVNAAQMSNVQR